MAVRTNTLDSQNNRNMVWDAATSRWVNQTQTDTATLTELQTGNSSLDEITTNLQALVKRASEQYILNEEMYVQLIMMNQLLLKISDMFVAFFGEGVRETALEDLSEHM